MGLKPGMTNNKNGRPPGSQNKISSELRIKITGFLDTNFDVIVKDFEKLSPRDRVKFYNDLLQFSVPRLQSTNLEVGFERLPDDQLDELYKKLEENLKNEEI